MYRYNFKLMLRSFADKVVPHREVMIRQSNTIKHVRLTPLKQFVFVVFIVALACWTYVSTHTYFNYENIIEQNKQELANAKDEYKKLVSEVAAYQDQLNVISEKINKNIQLSSDNDNLLDEDEEIDVNEVVVADKKGAIVSALKNSFANLVSGQSTGNQGMSTEGIDAEEKERLKGDVAWLGRKLNALSEGKTSVSGGEKVSVDVKLSKAELQRDLALSEARNLRNKVNEMESLIGEMQETQVVVFDKVAGLADDGIASIEKRLSGVKDSLNAVGLGFDTLLARVNAAYAKEAGTGGPFIPVSLSKPVSPDLKSDVLNVSLNNLVGGVNKWNNLVQLEEKLPIGKPVDRVRITSRYGVRSDPFTKQRARHEGLDFGGIRGEPIYTMSPGRVVYAGNAGSFGYMVEIDHGLGIRTRYAHLGSIEVKRGERVSLRQKIGTMGNSGRSTGVHLHYEIRMNGKPMDPLNFVRINRNVSKKY